MPIAIRAKTDPTGVTDTSFSVDKPTGTLEGDFMLLLIYAVNAALTVPTLPAGWQQVRDGVIAGTNGVMAFYKIAAASEPSSYALTTVASQTLAIGIISLYGDAAITVDTAAYQANGSSTDRTMPGVTASAAGLLISAAGLGLNLACTPPGGSTEQWEVTVGTRRVYCLSTPVASAGATGDIVATGTATTSLCISVLLIEAATTYPTPDLRSLVTTAPASVGSSFTCNVPDDVEAGDLLILHAALDADRTVTDPTGWTLRQSIAAAGGIRVWSKTADDDDAGSTVTVTFTGGTTTIGSAIAAFVSRSGKTLTVGASTQAVSGSATTVTLPDVTPTRANALLVGLVSSPDTTGTTPAANDDYLKRYDFGATGVHLVLWTEMLTAASATGTRTATWTSSSHVGNAVSLTIEEIVEGILYNGNDLRPWLKAWSLDATVGIADSTVLNSAAREQAALLPAWNFSGQGIWDSDLDDIFGAAVASSQNADNSLFVEIEHAVIYESATAYVAQYRSQETIDNIIIFDVRIGISGAPERSTL